MCLVLVLSLPFTVRSQSTVTVAVDDPIYRDVDRLIDAGLAPHAIVGQRPYSRESIALLVREARASLAAMPAGGDVVLRSGALARLLARFAHEVARLDGRASETDVTRWRPLDALRVDALATDAPFRPVPPNGLGTVEADYNGLIDYRQGRTYVAGSNVALESGHWIQFPGGISLQATPRLWLQQGRQGAGTGLTAEVLVANARAVRHNVAVTVGREYTEWSPATGSGLFFSDNAPALDMIRVASDVPFRLPLGLSRLGLVAATFQLADIGRSDSSTHSRLVSYKVNLKPTDAVELGATFENHFGGAGSRPASTFDRVADLVPFIDIFRHHVDSTSVDSDKLIGVDGRLHLRALGNVSLFGELALEDFDIHRLASIFTEDAAYTAGIIVPTLVVPAISARIGFHTVGLRFYEHHILRNGIASRRFILGDDLGRDASGVFAMLRWETPRGLSITGDVAADARSNDTYLGSYTNPDLTGLVFTRVNRAPVERRERAVVSARWFPPGARTMVEVRGGAERTSNFGFVARASELHALAGVTASWYQ